MRIMHIGVTTERINLNIGSLSVLKKLIFPVAPSLIFKTKETEAKMAHITHAQ